MEKSTFRKLIPRCWIQSYRRILLRAKIFTLKLFSRNGFLASQYYAFFSREFDREHKAVLAGQLAHYESRASLLLTSPVLRRNIHRLEKALVMRPRKPIFGESYIAETVSTYIDYISGPTCDQEKHWAESVLTKYFESIAAGQSDIIDAAKHRFESSGSTVQHGHIPYPYSNIPRSSVTYEDLTSLFAQRYSVRWFLPMPVPRHVIERAIRAASLAPSACNRQPYRFYVADKKEVALSLAKCAMGTVGFAENIVCMIAVVGLLDAYPKERDRHLIYIDGGLATMQMILALETLGVSTCIINFPDIPESERRIGKLLQLQAYERPLMLIAVGYADPTGEVPYSAKKTPEVLLKYVDSTTL